MDREQIAALLVEHDVMPTQQRLDVGAVIFAKPQHLSADQIIDGTRAMGSRVSKATVYNTLNLFCERGLLSTVNVDPTRQFYDPTTSKHYHLYNEDTGELSDISRQLFICTKTIDSPELSLGCYCRQYSLYFYLTEWVCNHCG